MMNRLTNKISVIAPIRNGENYIQACVASFLNQDLDDVEKEMIIVNDHSTDNSLNILKRLSEEHHELIIGENKGVGIIEALQTGLNLASGDYISRMDMDDIMPPLKLQRLFDVLQDQQIQVATGKVQYFHHGSKVIGEGFKNYENWLNDLVDKQDYFTDIYKECVVASPNWMMRKKDLHEVGAFQGIYPEDYDLVFRWYAAKLLVRGSSDVTHHWYDHSERASRNDIHYSNNNFFELKLHWFFKVDHIPARPILIYGAGNKGKYIVKEMLKRGVKVKWCSNNEKKIGKSIYGITLMSDQESITAMGCQIIVAIAVEADKVKIERRFQKEKLNRGVDYFFFA